MERLLQNRVPGLGAIEARRTAFIGVHWQEDVVGARGDLGDVFAAYVTSSNIISRTAKLFEAGRRAGALIVFVNVAVDHTTRDAAQYGYRTVLIEDCCCSSDPAYHDAALKSLRIIATNVVKADEFMAELTGAKQS